MRQMLVWLAPLLVIGCGGGGESADGGAAAFTPAASTSQLCGQVVGPHRLQGTVTSVHDGDTITVQADGTSHRVRLDGIDAPELAQPYGDSSQAALSRAVLGQTVRVAYGKTDQYGRVVGAVFTASCQYANLDQVAAGMAWFYKAYQCELAAAARGQLLAAQASAQEQELGLWAQADPEAPWFYRNGSDPATPTCASDQPSWSTSSGSPHE
jgi:endonuclease YncB( thermonuclease family)